MRELKDSGIDVVRMIPTTWTLSRLKYLCTVQTGNEDTQNADPDGEYPFYVRSPIIEKCKRFTFEGEGILMAGDGAGAGRIFHHVYGRYAVHQRVYRLSDFKNIDTDYFYYYLSNIFPQIMDKGSAQSTVPSVRLPMILNCEICTPTIYEQHRIANYLDTKCVEIDALTADIQLQVDTLEQYKRSVITEAVTKGLNPDTEMKNSGITWIGTIPENWDILRKLSYATTDDISYGIVKLMEPDDENGVKVIRCSDIMGGYIDVKHIRTVSKAVSLEYARTILRGGEVILSIRGSLGGCAVVPDSMAGYNIAREVAKISLNETMVNRFVMYYFLSMGFTNYLQRYLAGSVYIGLNIETLKDCSIPKPPKVEQLVICDYLDKKCGEIDEIIQQKQQQLSVIEEYKKSLIFEYVTGKKEVTMT